MSFLCKIFSLPKESELAKKYEQMLIKLQKQEKYPAFWQTLSWQMMLKKAGAIQKSFCIFVFFGEKIWGYACIEERDIGIGCVGHFILAGPYISSSKKHDYIPQSEGKKYFAQEIQKITKKHNALFCQYEPFTEISLPKFKRGGYKHFFIKTNAHLDLSISQDALLKNMKPKGRAGIKTAEKHAIKIKHITPTTQEEIEYTTDILYNLITQTTQRNKFLGNPKHYYYALIQALSKDISGDILFAYSQEDVVAIGIFIHFGHICLYYYGASSSTPEHRKLSAAYLLQWEAIKSAKGKGCTLFDFGGISHPDEKNSPLSGVTTFKMKFHPITTFLPETRIWISRPVMYFLFWCKNYLKNLRK